MKIDLEQYNYRHRSLSNVRFFKEIAAVVVGILFLMIVLFAATH